MQEATGRKLGLDTWNCDLWADGICSHPPAAFFWLQNSRRPGPPDLFLTMARRNSGSAVHSVRHQIL